VEFVKDFSKKCNNIKCFLSMISKKHHECLVIKTSGNSSKLSDQVFWYKAEAHNGFRVGHSKFWNFHNNNYNENYESDIDFDEAEAGKFKEKYANSKKLKVLVSRQTGKIIGVNPPSD
jgi:hypothetical protein